jgi:hypothetical protein
MVTVVASDDGEDAWGGVEVVLVVDTLKEDASVGVDVGVGDWKPDRR